MKKNQYTGNSSVKRNSAGANVSPFFPLYNYSVHRDLGGQRKQIEADVIIEEVFDLSSMMST